MNSIYILQSGNEMYPYTISFDENSYCWRFLDVSRNTIEFEPFPTLKDATSYLDELKEDGVIDNYLKLKI